LAAPYKKPTPSPKPTFKPGSRPPYQRGPQRKEQEHRINEGIIALKVRLVGDNIEPGVYNTADALQMARQQVIDLVEISPNADPPVCRLIDYNKFLYEKKKKDKEMKAASKAQQMKEIRFTPNTDDHDFNFKVKHSENFLKEGDKVRAYVQFKGRAIVYAERGQVLLLKFAQALEEFGVPDQMPKLEGKKMFIIIVPKKKK
jgi:translation initiation factor IF-3